MYSVVLATMLAAGSSTPAWHHHHSCYGSYYSSCYGSCYGSYYSSCYGSCYGSYYSSCYGGHGLFHRHHYPRHTGYVYNSCYGCCGGCCGGVVYSSCYGCCGGCCGGVIYSSCYGCCGGTVIVPSAPVVVPVPVVPATPKTTIIVPTVPMTNTIAQSTPNNAVIYAENTNNAVRPVSVQPAKVTVVLPAEARLWVDSVECPLTSGVRSFNTPPLNSNQQYFYNMKVELVQNGRTISETQRVLLTSGQESRVDFTNVGASRFVAR